jgi:hypothetical protein
MRVGVEQARVELLYCGPLLARPRDYVIAAPAFYNLRAPAANEIRRMSWFLGLSTRVLGPVAHGVAANHHSLAVLCIKIVASICLNCPPP